MATNEEPILSSASEKRSALLNRNRTASQGTSPGVIQKIKHIFGASGNDNTHASLRKSAYQKERYLPPVV